MRPPGFTWIALSLALLLVLTSTMVATAVPLSRHGVHSHSHAASSQGQLQEQQGSTMSQDQFQGVNADGTEGSDLVQSTETSSLNSTETYPLSMQVKHTVNQIVNLFETGNLVSSYAYIEDLHDGRGYTCGSRGLVTSEDEMVDLIQRYTEVDSGNPLAKHLPALQELSNKGSPDTNTLPGFPEDWVKANDDALFRTIQDQFADELFFSESEAICDRLGLRLPVSRAQIFDAVVMHGTGVEAFGVPSMVIQAGLLAKGTPATGVDESKWVESFMEVRAYTMTHADNATSLVWAKARGRVKTLAQLQRARPRLNRPFAFFFWNGLTVLVDDEKFDTDKSLHTIVDWVPLPPDAEGHRGGAGALVFTTRKLLDAKAGAAVGFLAEFGVPDPSKLTIHVLDLNSDPVEVPLSSKNSLPGRSSDANTSEDAPSLSAELVGSGKQQKIRLRWVADAENATAPTFALPYSRSLDQVIIQVSNFAGTNSQADVRPHDIKFSTTPLTGDHPSLLQVNTSLAALQLPDHNIELVENHDDVATTDEDKLPSLAKESAMFYQCAPQPNGRKVVALTFDDGPMDTVAEDYHSDIHSIAPMAIHANLAEALHKEHAKASFFFVGSRINDNPDHVAWVKCLDSMGHTVGSHTWSHPHLTEVSVAEGFKDMDRSRALLRDILNRTSPKGIYFRPPYGEIDYHVARRVIDQGDTTVLWTLDTLDWFDPESETVRIDSLRGLDEWPNPIILFHEETPLNRLADVIAELRDIEPDVEFVNIEQCLHPTIQTDETSFVDLNSGVCTEFSQQSHVFTGYLCTSAGWDWLSSAALLSPLTDQTAEWCAVDIGLSTVLITLLLLCILLRWLSFCGCCGRHAVDTSFKSAEEVGWFGLLASFAVPAILGVHCYLLLMDALPLQKRELGFSAFQTAVWCLAVLTLLGEKLSRRMASAPGSEWILVFVLFPVWQIPKLTVALGETKEDIALFLFSMRLAACMVLASIALRRVHKREYPVYDRLRGQGYPVAAPSAVETVKEDAETGPILHMLPLCRESAKELEQSFKCFNDANLLPPGLRSRLRVHIFLDGQADDAPATPTLVALRDILRRGGDASSWDDGQEKHRYASRVWTGVYCGLPTTLFVKGDGCRRGKRHSQLLFFKVMDEFCGEHGLRAEDVLLWLMDGDVFVDGNGLAALMRTVRDDPTCVGATANLWPSNFTFWNPLLPLQFFEYLCGNACKEAESSLRAVTVLCGCCTVVRWSAVKACLPEYSVNPKASDIVHCNLLNLGEDRYLTSLLLHQHPSNSTRLSFATQAFTTCPDTFVDYVTQRRRWINSSLVNDVSIILSRPPGTSLLTWMLVASRTTFAFFGVGLVVALMAHMNVGGYLDPTKIAAIICVYLVFFFLSVCNRAAADCRAWLLGNAVLTSLTCFYAIICVCLEWDFSLSFVMLSLFWGTLGTFFLVSCWGMYVETICGLFCFLSSMGLTFLVIPLYSYANLDDLSWGTRGIANSHNAEAKSTLPPSSTGEEELPFLKQSGPPDEGEPHDTCQLSAWAKKMLTCGFLFLTNIGMLYFCVGGKDLSLPLGFLVTSLFYLWYCSIVAVTFRVLDGIYKAVAWLRCPCARSELK